METVQEASTNTNNSIVSVFSLNTSTCTGNMISKEF